MEQALLQRKITYGIIGGLIGALPVFAIMRYVIPWFTQSRAYSDYLPYTTAIIVVPPILLTLLSSLVADIDETSRRWRRLIILWVLSAIILGIGLLTLFYFFFVGPAT